VAFFSPPASCRATETERKIVQCAGLETTRKRDGGKQAEARGRERGSERGNVWREVVAEGDERKQMREREREQERKQRETKQEEMGSEREREREYVCASGYISYKYIVCEGLNIMRRCQCALSCNTSFWPLAHQIMLLQCCRLHPLSVAATFYTSAGGAHETREMGGFSKFLRRIRG